MVEWSERVQLTENIRLGSEEAPANLIAQRRCHIIVAILGTEICVSTMNISRNTSIILYFDRVDLHSNLPNDIHSSING